MTSGVIIVHYRGLKQPYQLYRFLLHLQDCCDFAGKLSDVKRFSYKIFSAGF
jgi:hypothetical protein